jgi:hypothetical protein
MTPDETKMQNRKIRLMKIALVAGAIGATILLERLNTIIRLLEKISTGGII